MDNMTGEDFLDPEDARLNRHADTAGELSFSKSSMASVGSLDASGSTSTPVTIRGVVHRPVILRKAI